MTRLPQFPSALLLVAALACAVEAAVETVGLRSRVHAGFLVVEASAPESIRVELLDLDGEYVKTLTSGEVSQGELRFRLPTEAISGMAMLRVRRIDAREAQGSRDP